VPAAVGAAASTRRVTQSDAALLIGGGTPWGFNSTTHYVQQVDFVAWFNQSFTSRDHIVLKMDVEGAEHNILRRMIRDGSIHKVDLLLWECHPIRSCHSLGAELKQQGVKLIHDPYRFPRFPLKQPTRPGD